MIHERVADVHALPVPDPAGHPVFRRAWERIDYLQAHSDLPLRVVNVPSPLVTASLIWDYTSFIEALMLYPDEAHVLLKRISDATAALLSPNLYREFGVRYNGKIAEAFGGGPDRALPAPLPLGPPRAHGLVAYTKKIVDCFGRKGVFIQTSVATAEEAPPLGEALHGLLAR